MSTPDMTSPDAALAARAGHRAAEPPAMVAVRGVSRTFGSGHTAVQALRDVSFTVSRGHLVAVVDEVCTDHPDSDLEYVIGGDFLDLEPIVHDASILELPLAPLCQDDCRGLCPECGVNRNHESCSCEAPDPRTD